MSVHFEVLLGEQITNLSVIYRPSESSFGVESPSGSIPNTVSAIVVNDVQLQIDEQYRVRYVDGYCHFSSWVPAEVEPPPVDQGALVVRGIDIIPGVSYSLVPSGAWPVWVNRKTGWVCIGVPSPAPPFEAVEFATDTVAVIKHGALQAVWLRPRQLPPELA